MQSKIINIILTASLVLIFLIIFSGCSGGKKDERGERVGVSGTVLLDGIPISNARIVFSEEGETGAVKATGAIVDGKYSILPERGPLVGKMRVEIQSETMDVEQLESIRKGDINKKVDLDLVKIPTRYNKRSKLTAEVTKETEKNVFDFKLEQQ